MSSTITIYQNKVHSSLYLGAKCLSSTITINQNTVQAKKVELLGLHSLKTVNVFIAVSTNIQTTTLWVKLFTVHCEIEEITLSNVLACKIKTGKTSTLCITIHLMSVFL